MIGVRGIVSTIHSIRIRSCCTRCRVMSASRSRRRGRGRASGGRRRRRPFEGGDGRKWNALLGHIARSLGVLQRNDEQWCGFKVPSGWEGKERKGRKNGIAFVPCMLNTDPGLASTQGNVNGSLLRTFRNLVVLPNSGEISCRISGTTSAVPASASDDISKGTKSTRLSRFSH